MNSHWHKVPIPYFLKTSKVYLKNIFRICLHNASNRVIINVTFTQKEMLGNIWFTINS